MERFVCILRGINVGGHRKILMKDLISLLEKNDFKNIKTYIQSGNVGFDSKTQSESEIENQIKGLILEQYGFDVPVIAIKKSEIIKVINNIPFSEIENVHVTFLKNQPISSDLKQIKAEDYLPEQFKIEGKVVYLQCSDKYHKSKLSNQFFERKLKVSATTRNWKTVNKLLELAEA